MNKLLHERLREFSKENSEWSNWFSLCSAIEVDCIGFKDFASKIADEIEKYYTPYPRDEKGEPVHFDEQIDCGYVRAITFNGNNNGFFSGKFGIILDNDTRLYKNNEPVKRPKPKVLDADGVEIKVGDTCWYTENLQTEEYIGNRVKIKEISDEGRINVFNCSSGHWQYEILGSSLTHKEPDSLKKLLRDMIANDSKTHNSEYSERLAALIERGA